LKIQWPFSGKDRKAVRRALDSEMTKNATLVAALVQIRETCLIRAPRRNETIFKIAVEALRDAARAGTAHQQETNKP
jgi:hypothetical protein